MKDNGYGPVQVAELIQPHMIMAKWFPRTWVFKCGNCSEKVIKFGWFGYAKCPFCRTWNAPRWSFSNGGY